MHIPEGTAVAVPVTILLTVIANAVVYSHDIGGETCLYCSWQRPYNMSDEESDRLILSSQEAIDAWWAELCATNLHDETCVVTILRTLLGIPNPRAVYQEK